MKRFRLLVVGALALGSLGLGVPSASACQPDGPCPCSDEPTKTLNDRWERLTGQELIRCTY